MSSRLLTARLHAALRTIYPVLFLLPQLASILALPKRCPLSIYVLHLIVDCLISVSVWSTFEHALASPSNCRIIWLTPFLTLSSIVTCLLMNSYTVSLYNPFQLLHHYCPHLHSLPQPMLPNVAILSLMIVVSWLIGAEEEKVVNDILATIFISPAVSIFILPGSQIAVMVDTGSKNNNGLQQPISGHDNK